MLCALAFHNICGLLAILESHILDSGNIPPYYFRFPYLWHNFLSPCTQVSPRANSSWSLLNAYYLFLLFLVYIIKWEHHEKAINSMVVRQFQWVMVIVMAVSMVVYQWWNILRNILDCVAWWLCLKPDTKDTKLWKCIFLIWLINSFLAKMWNISMRYSQNIFNY